MKVFRNTVLYSLPPAYVVRHGKVLFSQVSVCPHPGGRIGSTTSPSHNTSTGPMSFLVGTPVTSPSSLPRGYPSQVQMGGGYPSQIQTGEPPILGWGTPWPGQDGGTQGWGTPCPEMGYPPPPSQVRTGCTPGQSIPPPQDDGVLPPPPPPTQLGQQKEYLLRGRQYASCVHAGGLSCLT